MKTMITRNNVPRHNGTMRCLLGRNGPREFRAIAPRHGALVRGMGIWSEAWAIWSEAWAVWSEARSGNGPRDRLGVTVRYTSSGTPEDSFRLRKFQQVLVISTQVEARVIESS